jgi:endonuclease III
MMTKDESAPLNLMSVTDDDVRETLVTALAKASYGSNCWRVLGAAEGLSKQYSFSETRTYPRPDHPNPKKRKPLVYMMVGILVSLRTTLENEQRAMAEVLERFPTVDSLRMAGHEELVASIRCAGMAEVRAKRIRRAIDYVDTHFGGSLESLARLPLHEAREQVLGIPGFGPKAADCLLSIGLGKASIAVDVNVFRVTSWLFALRPDAAPDYGDREQVEATKRLLDEALPESAFICQIVHTLFLLHGKRTGRIHTPNTDCRLRPFCLSCVASSAGKPEQQVLIGL